MKYDLLVFIGRFQPLHLGHQEVIERALSLSERVLVLVGGEGKARSTRNPFTYLERRNMIKTVFPSVIVRGVKDHTYNDTAWIEEVQRTVKEVALGDKWNALGMKDLKIGLIGHAKDNTSYYLKLFPELLSEDVPVASPLNATAIREMFFAEDHQAFELSTIMHRDTVRWIKNEFMGTPEAERLRAEFKFLKDYKAQYGAGPFLTADALVQVGGNILLITRGKEYGQGLLALPGGFVNPNEKFLDGALRELKEETKIKVPRPVLKGSIVNSFLADEPHRSERGRIISQVQHIKLENEVNLPEVRGSDDADHAEWVDTAWITENEDKFFEDHHAIIMNMLGIVKRNYG